jgi:hypothetical protein
MTAEQIASRLGIPHSNTFTIIHFPTPAEGLAAPVFRTNPGFIGGGLTSGGAPEFVIPNGPISLGATIFTVGRMKLQPHEVKLVGRWLMDNSEPRPDTTCERIRWLTSNHLREVAISKEWGAWETLYQDPDDGRFWERTYPQGERQGGRPSRVNRLDKRSSASKIR